jgi:hypothetical protein
MLFVERRVPSNSFYLFHDVVTLMESLSMAHVERKDMLQEWYQSTKVGINEASARHMASFRLVLPTVFSRTREGAPVSARHHFPALKSFKDWNNYDGVSGVKGYIAGESQIKALVLAMEMHKLSQNFILEMSSWIDAFFQELVTMSEASEEEAWEVIGSCKKKMFEVIRVPWAQAANATMDPNPSSQCATYLWALVQAHRIMKEFIDSTFCNHASIAPAIVLHIFKTLVTRVSLAGTAKRLEGRIAVLEKAKESKK